MRVFIFMFLFLSSLFLLTACGDDDNPYIDNPPEEAIINRTLLVYLARDNDLSTYQEEKIQYILEGWNGKGGNILIYQDKLNEEPALYKIKRENEENSLELIRQYGEENSASAEVLSRVISEVKSSYPADSYGLIFFSHASGWIPEKIYETTRSIGKDGEDVMELIDFAEVIPGKLFDFIIFEACHMAGIEIAYELMDKTDYILASAAEIVSPGFRTIYPETIDLLFSENPDLEGFARKAFTWLNDTYGSATFSIIQTEHIPALAEWLRENMTEEFSGTYNVLQPFDRKNTHLFYDFEDYFSYLVPTGKKAELQALISACIPYKQASSSFLAGYGVNGFPIEKHSGLTTYIMKEELADLNERYKALKWYQAVY